MKKILLICLIVVCKNFCADNLSKDFFGFIQKRDYDNALEILKNPNFHQKTNILDTLVGLMNIFFPECLIQKKYCTIIDLFKLLIEKNEFSFNFNVYKYLKSKLQLKIKNKRKRYMNIMEKLDIEIFKMIKNKLKEQIDFESKVRNDFQKITELGQFPGELKMIILDYLTTKDIPIDLYADLCTNEIESAFDKMVCDEFENSGVPPEMQEDNNQNKNCCIIL